MAINYRRLRDLYKYISYAIEFMHREHISEKEI